MSADVTKNQTSANGQKRAPVPCPLPAERLEYWEERCSYFPTRQSILLPLLHDLQDHIGYVSREAMIWAAEFVGISPVEVYGVASFYWMYDFAPRAKKRIAVCHNISCDLRGKDQIVAAIREELGIPEGETRTPDGEWSLRTVECLGSCTTAPMMDVNGRYFEELTADKVKNVLRLIRDGQEALPEEPPPLPPALGDKLAFAYEHRRHGESDPQHAQRETQEKR